MYNSSKLNIMYFEVLFLLTLKGKYACVHKGILESMLSHSLFSQLQNSAGRGAINAEGLANVCRGDDR